MKSGIKVRIDTKGLKKLRASARKSVARVRVGFLGGEEYPEGQKVATVAAAHEFGTSRGIPERPFFRQAIEGSKAPLGRSLARNIGPDLIVTEELAEQLGEKLADAIRTKIFEHDLKDTGRLSRSVAVRVEKNIL